MPEAAGRMEEAQRLSGDLSERAQAALGLSMVRFLAAELPQAIAACEDVHRGAAITSNGSCSSGSSSRRPRLAWSAGSRAPRPSVG